MKQDRTIAFDAYASFCEKGITGLRQYGADLKMAHITAAVLAGKLDGARKGQGDYQTAINGTLAAMGAQAAMRHQVVGFITLTRDVLKQKLGARYSKAWTEVGFLNATLAVPRVKEKQLSLVKTIELYYTAHPDAEAAVLGLTRQRAADLHAAYLAAMAAVEAARVLQRQSKESYNAAFADLRASRQILFRELKTLLAANDPRWLEFGFNVPGDVITPAAPEGLAVVPGIPGHVRASWQRPVGAKRFRIFGQIVGADDAPVPLNTTNRTALDLSGLTSGARVKLYVVAANAAGESLPSATVEVVVP